MQLLHTKFHIPEFNGDASVSRRRIGRLIHDHSSIVIVSAPAGFGKTTFLSEWVELSQCRAAWVSLEASENIPAVFWSYFITAVSSVLSGCGSKSLEQIKTSEITSIENILIGLINEIAADGTEFTIVLDDYHVITDDLIHRGMELMLDHIPPNMRIVIAGREDPKLSISKLRLSGKLTEIRAPQFRFNAHEAEHLINKVYCLGLSKDDILSLRDKTEGWGAGLALAILSMKEQTDRRAFIDDFTGSHRYIIDYLIEEVLSGLDDDVRDFMLKISILERFSLNLCRFVSGNAHSGTILNHMEQNNLFLIPLDNRREWFRYHHLFREFLLKNLMEKDPGEAKMLHGKAFCWLKENGYENEAFHHGILAEDYSRAAELLAEKAPELFVESGGFLLKRLIDRLPEGVVNKSPELCSYRVWLDILAGDFESMGLLHQDIFKGNQTVSGFVSLIKSYLYFYQSGEFDKSIREMNECLGILPRKHFSVREMGELILNLSLRYSGDIQAARHHGRTLPPDGDSSVLRAITHADILLGMGKLEPALLFINDSIENGKHRYGEDLVPEYGYLYILKAGILRERDDIPSALKACRKGLYLGRNNEYVEFVFLGNLEYSRILAVEKNYAEAEKAMAVSIEAARLSSTWGEFMSAAYRVRIEIARGNIDFAGELLKEMPGFSERDIPYYRSHEYLSYCRYCICRNRTERVHEITRAMIREDVSVKRHGRLIECYILKAVAYSMENERERALETLAKAFQLTEKPGHVRLYLDEGERIQGVLAEALKRGILPEYLTGYVDRSKSGQGGTNKNEVRSVIINDFNENFNEREIEILKLMKTGASNRNIADTLFLSVNTVRWYASRIFAKLNVKRRGEAVAFAEKYRLI